MQNIKILVAAHKPDKIYQDNIYTPIQVGKEISQYNLDILSDNIGDNISKKNPMYCELTALYWAWKNLRNIDFIGLCHYRRYFDFHKQSHWYLPISIMPTQAMQHFDFSIPSTVFNKLKQGNIIVSKKEILRESLYTHYCIFHISDDIRTLKKVIEEQNDYQYIQAFNKVMLQDSFSPYNMFIMSWNEFDKYCTWLFSVLSKVENKIDISNYNNVQRRIYGYMAERLLNIYIEAQNIKTYKYPVVQFTDSQTLNNQSFIEYCIKSSIKKISHLFSLPPANF